MMVVDDRGGMTDEKLSMWDAVCSLLGDARTASSPPLGPSPDARWRALRDTAADWAQGLADQETFTATRREWDALGASVADTIRAGLEPSDAALAAAWGIDDVCWPAFTPHWIRAQDDVFTLDNGEFFPVDDAQWPAAGSPITSRPANLGVRAGELPHVRVHEASPVAIEWDSRSRIELTAALDSARVIAGVLPASVREGDEAIRTNMWAREVRQRAIHFFASAADRANVVVLPELSTDDDLIRELQDLTPADVLVVGGSRMSDADDGRRVNRASWWVGEMRFEHDKYAPARNEVDDWGLQPTSPRITLALAHGWRVAVLICRDLLAPDVLAALIRAGVSLVLVPAWTARTEAFEAAAASLAVYSQAVTIAVFGPEPGMPVGLIGRPFRDCIAVAIDGEPPGYWLATLDTDPPKYFAGT